MIDSVEEFVRLRTSENRDEYSRAANEEASDETWLSIIETAPEMRMWVAQNKTVPLSILRILADDQDSQVRWMVAQKGKIDHALLEKLAADPDESVRQRVVYNRSTPPWLLERMAHDEAELVAQAARERIAEISKL